MKNTSSRILPKPGRGPALGKSPASLQNRSKTRRWRKGNRGQVGDRRHAVWKFWAQFSRCHRLRNWQGKGQSDVLETGKESRNFFFSGVGGRTAWHVGSQFPDQGSNPRLLQWERRVLITGPPGKSREVAIFDTFHVS